MDATEEIERLLAFDEHCRNVGGLHALSWGAAALSRLAYVTENDDSAFFYAFLSGAMAMRLHLMREIQLVRDEQSKEAE